MNNNVHALIIDSFDSIEFYVPDNSIENATVKIKQAKCRFNNEFYVFDLDFSCLQNELDHVTNQLLTGKLKFNVQKQTKTNIEIKGE